MLISDRPDLTTEDEKKTLKKKKEKKKGNAIVRVAFAERG